MNRALQILHFDRFNIERSVYDPGLHMPAHVDKLSRISIILKGELKETTAEGSVHASENYIVIKPKHVAHENTFGPKPLHLLSISFNDDHLMKAHWDNWAWFNHPGIQVAGMRLWSAVQSTKKEDALLGQLSSFFSMVTRMQPGSTSPSISWPDALRDRLQSDLAKPEGLQQLAGELCLHRVSMARGFKKQYGLSPVQFRQYTRVMKAMRELAITTKSVAAIAFDSGFADQAHLTRTLKDLAGCTPHAFRKLHR